MMKHITLAHGNGGRLMRELIHSIIAPAFNMSAAQTNIDAVAINSDGPLMLTTDGYTVDPLFFPGGNIGKLAVCGTLNDLLVSGAIPRYLTVNLFIEEGFLIDDLTRIVKSMGEIAAENQVSIVAGDTKVLPKGAVSGIQIATTGIGKVFNAQLSMDKIKAGDKLFVSGSIGDHGTAVMLARDAYGLSGQLTSDCQSLKFLARFLMDQPTVKFMRDPTRGGLATVCHEISQTTKLGVHLIENNIPIQQSVKGFCELLGFNPLYLACEGRIVFVTSAEVGIDIFKRFSNEIALVGVITDEHQQVIIETPLGGLNLLAELENEALPRIC